MSTNEDMIQTEKGDAVVDVKVYDGTTSEAMDAIREVAVNNFKLTSQAVGR